NRPTYLKRDSLEEYSGKATGSANFSVEISTNNVCVFTNNFNVEVYNPKSVFEWKLDTTCTGLNLFLSNHSKGDSVAWKMNGELLELPENGLLNNLNFSKQYTVDLLAFEKFCSDTFSQTFSAQNPASFNYSYPNVITPNNDGLNDCFLVETEQSRYCHNYRFWVYNRWGEILYKSETENEIPCWDGTNMLNDQLVSQGTYFFILEIENQRYNGTITVLY
ncbi:MAG: gliding motility-associated C-terminal domain-containing protein, partial [Bacteroidetes bacterium]|nr:gliding motility-associated C-terminal domain-containing protein [Bacteroidota bacterium]